MKHERTLGQRLGKTAHVSPLRFALSRLRERYPCAWARCTEDWLLATANARGACVVVPARPPDPDFIPPDQSELSNEDLVVAICQLQGLDRPQLLRLAAQFVSRRVVDVDRLRLVAERERVEPVLAELARQALKVDPEHPTWQTLHDVFRNVRPLTEPLLHWTRLAEPVMRNGRCNAEAWRLVA